MGSLKLRLAVGLGASLLVLLGLQYALVSGAISGTAERYLADGLSHRAETLIGALEWEADGPELEVPDAAYQRPYSGHYYRVEAGDEAFRSRSLWEAELPMPELAVGERRQWRTDGPQGQRLLVRAVAVRARGEPVRVAVAEDLSPLHAEVRDFQWRYALIALGVGAALLTLQWGLLAVGLRPLERLREQVAALARGERRELDGDVPAEVRPLVAELNRLVRVLEDRLQRSRRATGNLAHALKTPLTRLFQLAEEPEMPPAVAARLRDPAAQIRERIDRELKRAKLAGGSPAQRFDPGREVPALIRVLERTYAERAPAIAYEGPPPGQAFGEREDLIELLGNLLDNACKWARSQVVVRVAVDGGGLALTVADDGPGVPAEQRAALTERGGRVDEQVAGDGLGLAIVNDLVAAYGGSLRFATADLGGLAVHVALPARTTGASDDEADA